MKLFGNDYEVLHSGVAYGYLPKVGEDGYLIHYSLYDGKWNFKTLLPSEGWFQTWDSKGNNELDWFHGVVGMDGHIKQIG